MGNIYVRGNLKKRMTLLGIENTGDYINEVLEREVKKEEEKRKK